MVFSLFKRGRRRVPYRMFDHEFHGLEAKNARVLERIYHKGQSQIWDGQEVLQSLIAEHGQPTMAEDKKRALGRVFSLILWGELAAWRISAELADEIEPLEAKMAATSQAFDEARHFYVMHDYLTELNALPDRLEKSAERLLESVMNADSLAKKLLGMQLMVEPIALTLFQVVRKLQLEPVLCHLLPYYERDEARHVALGLKYLPALVSRMSPLEKGELWLYQLKLLSFEILAQRSLQHDLQQLGLNPRDLVAIGQAKQLAAFDLVFTSLNGGKRDAASELTSRYVEFFMEMTLPDDATGDRSILTGFKRAVGTLFNNSVNTNPEDLVPDVADEDVPLIQANKARKPKKKGRSRKQAS